LDESSGGDVYVADRSRIAVYGSSARFYKIAQPDGQIRIDLTGNEETFPSEAAQAIISNMIASTG
jgi:hypothetical protein